MEQQSDTLKDQALPSEPESPVLQLPLLPLRDVVVFPHTVVPLYAGRKQSVASINHAMDDQGEIFLLAQRDPSQEEFSHSDLFDVGVIASVLRAIKLPDGTVKILVEGLHRAKMTALRVSENVLIATVQKLEEKNDSEGEQADMLLQLAKQQFMRYAELNDDVESEFAAAVGSMQDPSQLVDSIAVQISLKLEARQKLLEALSVEGRMRQLIGYMKQEIGLLELEHKIQEDVKQSINDDQRRYYIREKIKALSRELEGDDDMPMGMGMMGVGLGEELRELEEKIKAAGMPQATEDKVLDDVRKLKMVPPMSAEATVLRAYLETVIALPWKKQSKVSHDIEKAKACLHAHHYGLKEVKERILEYLAVQTRVKKLNGPILCLVGPPGTGKTSLAKSIAKAVGRQFANIALGGVRDESEIRGHRRTYVGSMPGRIIKAMQKVGVNNPVILLDEVDKMGMDYRGDPASALLEVLDYEQNMAFQDHYLELDFDLSRVMFITTANSLNIPGPLKDRMEIIRIPGYTETEKLHISKEHLLPRALENHGLMGDQIVMGDAAMHGVIQSYTREAGVRELARCYSKVCRKVVRALHDKGADAQMKRTHVTQRNLQKYLGVRKFGHEQAREENEIGVVQGLAWTEVGGELLTIESVVVPSGSGKLVLTGKLGDVMSESMHAALSAARSRADQLGIPHASFKKSDFHVHVPEGATPKDGPSAGIAVYTALVSALTRVPVRSCVAMTGEITLRGHVLQIGGLKEKLLAAQRSGISDVIIPQDNEKDLVEIPKEILAGLVIHPVRRINEVLAIALEESVSATDVELAALELNAGVLATQSAAGLSKGGEGASAKN